MQPPKSAAIQQKPGRSQTKKDEDKEKLEVEMLNISTGDKGVSRDRGVAARNRARGRRDDSEAWDSDEQNCWKMWHCRVSKSLLTSLV